jgi:hypothetical protein
VDCAGAITARKRHSLHWLRVYHLRNQWSPVSTNQALNSLIPATGAIGCTQPTTCFFDNLFSNQDGVFPSFRAAIARHSSNCGASVIYGSWALSTAEVVLIGTGESFVLAHLLALRAGLCRRTHSGTGPIFPEPLSLQIIRDSGAFEGGLSGALEWHLSKPSARAGRPFAYGRSGYIISPIWPVVRGVVQSRVDVLF